MGHGSESGLYGFSRFVIDSNFVYLLREKECVYIWCKADEFVKKYDLKGFCTGMIISDIEESYLYCLVTNYDRISESNNLLAEAFRVSIDSDNIIEMLKDVYVDKDGINSVIGFNQENFFYKSPSQKVIPDNKTYMDLNIRLRQDSWSRVPEYSKTEVIDKLLVGEVKFKKSDSSETIFLLDIKKDNKIIGVIEKL